MNTSQLLSHIKSQNLETDLLVAIESNEIGFDHTFTVNVPIVKQKDTYICQYTPFLETEHLEYPLSADQPLNLLNIEHFMEQPESCQALLIEFQGNRYCYVDSYDDMMFSESLQDILYLKFLEAAGVKEIEDLNGLLA